MIDKYQDIFDRGVFPYIHNRLHTEIDDYDLAREVYNRFPVYIAFFKCNQEMILEMLLQVIRGIRLVMTNNSNAQREANAN